MQQHNTLSVCIVTYNSEKKVPAAVSSLKKYTRGVDYRLYVFDNGSSDQTKAAVLSADPDAVFAEMGQNFGFGRANNAVLPLLESKYHAIVNPDIRLDSDVLSEICRYLDENPDTVMASPRIFYPDGSEQLLPKRRPRLRYLLGRRLPFMKKYADEYTRAAEHFNAPAEIEFCTGCFSVIRTDVFKRLGGFDERFFMYFEDADLTLRAKQYGKTVFLPDCHVIHEWERSSAKSIKYLFIHISSMFKFFRKHRRT